MNFPKFCQKNTIGICAPSAGVGHKLESFDLSLTYLKSQGFKIIETKSVRTNDVRSADGATRGKEFNSLIQNEAVDIIVSASGGDYCNEMLEYIDGNAIIDNPKWICGASDPTSILFYTTTCLDIATIYGFNAGTFDWKPTHEFQKDAASILKGDIVEQRSFDYYDGCRDFSRSGVTLDEKVEWICNKPALDVKGRIIGGCLDVIADILESKYDGAVQFVQKYGNEGIIWYFDVFDMSPSKIVEIMTRFNENGYFNGSNAVIFGRTMFLNEYTDDDYIAALNDFFERSGIPYIYNADIGHVKPCMTIINGATACIEYTDGKGVIKQYLK